MSGVGPGAARAHEAAAALLSRPAMARRVPDPPGGPSRQNPGQSWVDQVLARRPAGVILVLSNLDTAQRTQLSTRGIPFVVLDPAADPGEDVPAIGAANWHGGLGATRHLIELGHRRSR